MCVLRWRPFLDIDLDLVARSRAPEPTESVCAEELVNALDEGSGSRRGNLWTGTCTCSPGCASRMPKVALKV
eukprot:1194560-Prorocentrum_minimum.AAC.7